ncbi:centrosome-associated protein 350 isoform X3 [Trichechus manatus latirostris]|uniref:Centrosome-associated protein 350 isoform X3 n=1 Tax=Trichechus manatus latirostris TaxID=127582 RepID=A0A2Y9QWX8_TRIMA|nr:centrosome-associated protein 350 isoform X3 [Trichechus manatus latirostris]
MWSSKSKEVPLPNPRNSLSKDTVQADITTSWDALSQNKAALRHIENKLEVAPTSTAVFDSVMDTKKSSANATRKISRKDGRYLDDSWVNASTSKSSKSRKEKSRSPLRATTLESNVKKNNRVEFRDPLVSYREIHGVPSNLSSNHLESKLIYCVDANEEKTESGNRMIRDREEQNMCCCDFESSQSSVINDTVVRFLNDRPAIDALQNSECLIKMAAPLRTEEEKPNRSKGSENNLKASVSNMSHEVDPKVLRLTDSSPSSTSTSSSQRLDILKRRQHDTKLEKLKERIRKQWEHSEETNGQGQNLGHSDHPVVVVNVDSSVTAKVRKVATAPPAPAYKDDISIKEKPAEKSKEKKVVKPVRKVQKAMQLSSPECKTGSSRLISTSSWRDGQKLVKKILGPAPRMEQKERRTVSSDRSGRERTTKSGSHIGRAESDPRLDVSHRRLPQSSERSRSRARSENNIKKLAPSLPDNKQEEATALNKDFLPVEIRGILDDLQLDSVTQTTRQETGELQNQKLSAPGQAPRSHSPVKRKPDKITANEDPPVISKKRHYDTDEVRQYIVRQQEERKRKQNEEKKAQKEATEQKNKRLQELYRKQKEAFTKVKNVPPSEPSATRRLQETYSKLLLEKTLLEEPSHQQHATQETQARPGYQPSGESDKENKVQERPPSASSSSDMSLSEPPQPLARKDLMEPTWMQPDRLSPRVHHSQPQPLVGTAGNLLSHLLSLEHVGILNKDFESILPTRKNHNMASAPLTFTPQTYLTSPAAHPDALLKPSASQYKSKLDRIEALKATAASLSSRIESEAKKLAGANINYGSLWNTECDMQQAPQEDEPWTKAISPPVKEDTEDVFSARIQKMLGTCVSHATFDNDLPGVGNLSEFKKLPEMIRPHSAISSFRMRSPGPKPEGLLAQLCKRQTDSSSCDVQACSQDKAKMSHGSSTDSISEGPLLSEGSLSEEEGGRDGRPLLKVAEILKEKEFCAGERNTYEPIKEFQKEAEKFLPLFGHIGGTQSKGPWEELAKGSPHSVINIFTKSYQLYGKGFEDRLERGASALRPLNTIKTPLSSVSYEDDFVSSPESGTLTEKKSALEFTVGIQEEHSSRKSAYLSSVDVTSQHSSGAHSAASSRSSTSSKGKKGKKEKIERLDSLTGNVQNSVLDEEKIQSGSERGSYQGKKPGTSSKHSVKDYEQTLDSESMLEDLSGHSVSVSSEKGRSQKTPTSPLSPSSQKLLQFDLPGTSLEKTQPSVIIPPTTTAFKPNAAFTDINLTASRTTTDMASTPGSKRFSPAGLQHRLAAELNYLSAIEESMRQLSDVERVRGISLAQQESVSLAQIIKAQQQRHERDLALLKLKAEQEALESQRQLEETRNKAAQVHAESLKQVVKSQREVTEVLQEATCKIAAQQTETARLTTDAARQICEMAELTRTHISDAITASGAPLATLYDHQRQHPPDFVKQLRTRAETDRKSESVSLSQSKEGTLYSKHQKYSPSYDSYSESRYKNHNRRSSSGSSRQESPSVPSSKENEKKLHGEKTESSIDEHVQTAADDSVRSDSIPSLPDEKDSTSIATEYSLKFDESMTEDEIEEKSFRSLLPSESHRRFNMEKKRGHHDDSDEEASPEKTTLSSVKELSMPFSGGQDSFSKFTMEMVRQYMKEEEMRAAHQSSLLRLREKALREKTKAELAWLEHQKKHLRDKGEDDKMPPLRKKQRGLLLRLQQEKAEIKRLQEANKAARKERQLILKQQEEIERIRQTTIKLQEKLKSAGENKLESHSDDDTKDNKTTSPGPTDLETRSPSPISISSSETSSIMQKLKKMRSHMDEKFLTKREQKLMQRRQHAEELLEWKRRLDAEEAEIRQMEKQALAAWDKELIKPKTPKKELEDQRTEHKEIASEEESPVPSYSNLNSGSSVPEELGSPAVEYLPSEPVVQEQPGSPDHSILTEEMVFSQELESSTSPSKHSPPKSCTSVSKQESSKGSHRTGGQYHLPIKSHQHCYSWSDESLSMTQSETTSDQSDIEGRIRALKDELRKRKSVVDQLKKEQKKRQKERLKAQEASLIKQLESYDEFIKKTEAELSRDLETSPTAKPQIKTLSSASEKPKIKPLPLHRTETTKNWKSLTESERSKGSLESIAEHVDAALSDSERSVSGRSFSSYAKRVIELDSGAEELFHTSSPVLRSSRKNRAESGDSLENISSLPLLNARNRILDVSEAKIEEQSNKKSEIQEEVEFAKLEKSEIEDAYSKQSGKSDVLLKLDLEQGDSSEILSKRELPLDPVNVQKDVVRLAVENLHKKEEMLKERQSDQDVDHSPKFQPGKDIHEQKNLKEKDSSLSEHLSVPRGVSYSEDFEASSPRKDVSAELYKDDFEVSSLLSLGKDSQPMGRSRSRATSFDSDDEISECLSEKSLSIHSSVHSERLLELKSPTELMKSKERSDVQREQGVTESLSLASVSIADELLDFHIGDRVLIGNVQPGTLRFKGVTSFAEGFWAGVELDKPEGNNNGTYDGIVYFVCKEKHGIFAPPQKISHIPENFDDYIDINEDEDSYSDEQYRQYYNQQQKDTEVPKSDREKDTIEYFYEKSPSSMHDIEASVDRSLRMDNIQDISGALEAHVHQQSSVDSLVSSKENKDLFSGATEKVSIAVEDDTLDNTFSEELKKQPQFTEKEENLYSEVSEKLSTPLLDLLTREKKQLESQLRSSLSEEQKSQQQLETVSLLTNSLLKVFVTDTVKQLQQIKRVRNEKIYLSNQELVDDDQEKVPPQGLFQNFEEQSLSVPSCLLRSELEDEKEEISSPDMCPRPESPVFGASGQEELAKRLAELEISREFLSVLGDDQDWFDEDFGLSSSHKVQKNKVEETIVPVMAESKRPPQKPCETLLAVPHTAEEVEILVHDAAEELWKWKELGHDLRSISIPTKLLDSVSKGQDIESISKRVYKQAVFDLTKEIFEEIFAEDPNLNQPVWMKPCRINSSYFRRVKNPNDLDEIKNFIATEVLKLFSLKKESNHKTDWQKMMKFGRKKRDRVDHILVQELHEEEAQWVNYDEDELCVKMQLADGIFETLIRDTIDVLNQISEKQGRMLLV